MTITVPSPRAGLAAVILALLLLPAPASAGQGATFAVDPRGASASRGYYVFDVDGGAVLKGQVRIANIGDRAGVARLDAVDAATGATTGAVYRSRTGQRWDVGAWTAMERPTVRVRPCGGSSAQRCSCRQFCTWDRSPALAQFHRRQ